MYFRKVNPFLKWSEQKLQSSYPRLAKVMVIQNYHFIQEDFWPDIQFYFLVTFVLGYADNLDCGNTAWIVNTARSGQLEPPYTCARSGGDFNFSGRYILNAEVPLSSKFRDFSFPGMAAFKVEVPPLQA